jgi:4-hydroxy-2-oxoheptanedioate aldolase
MRENKVKAAWRTGKIAYGGWLGIPSSFSAEVMAHQGFDYVTIDMQHGLIDYQVAVTMLQALSTTNVTPFVRVPWNEPGIIGKMLDAGAYGIIVPMVNSVAEAQAAVGACRYAPQGYRSFGPIRAAYYAGGDYAARANDEIACIPMIETTRAIAQLDDILAVPGIDAVYVGPADLSLTLGLQPRMDNTDASFEEARMTIVNACKDRAIIAGIHANAQLAPRHAKAGYQMITISSDTGSLAAGAALDMRTVRDSINPGGQPAYS